MKIALAQINPIVGDLLGNSRKIIRYATQARQKGADLVVFPELCVTGYPHQDLVEKSIFMEAVEGAIEQIVSGVPRNIGIIIGAPVPNPAPIGKRLYNAALLYEGGKLKGQVFKTLLPTYDVFDEQRYFEPAAGLQLVSWKGIKIALHICEDMWNSEEKAECNLYEDNPIDTLAALQPDLYINISASPFSVGKHEQRNTLVQQICRDHHIPFVLVNTVGANTELIFDGDSRVHDAEGTQILCAPSFEEALLVWEVEGHEEPCIKPHEDIEDLHDALVLGIRDYFKKTGAFRKVLVGLSGGIDSAVTCVLAVQALGSEKVVGVTMPSRYSSPGSVDDSKTLAKNLGTVIHELPINPAVDAFDEMLADQFAGLQPDVAEENIQARVRGVTLMALSNKFNYLLLSTGNKSEMAVGYATLYGDMNGGLAVLADVFKMQVYALAEYINRRAGRHVIPTSIITKTPSAELRPDQKDTDSLPPYEVLDEILHYYIEEHAERDYIVDQTGFDGALVDRILQLVDRNEYKRRQAPPGLRVSGKAFGVGRRLPIVMRWNRDDITEVIMSTKSR